MLEQRGFPTLGRDYFGRDLLTHYSDGSSNDLRPGIDVFEVGGGRGLSGY